MAELTDGEGLSNVEAAEVLGIDERTVRRDRTSANAEDETTEQIGPGAASSANAEPPPEPETPPLPEGREWGKGQELAKEAGHPYQTCRDAGWVADRFQLSRRRDNLSFSHHREVAPLPTADQERLLDRAAALRRAAPAPDGWAAGGDAHGLLS